MLSIAAKSPLHTPIHVAFLSVVALGLAPGVVYKSRAPDLYPNNVHSKSGWILVVLRLALHFVSGIFKTLLCWALAKQVDARPSSQQYAAADTATLNGYEDETDELYSSEFGYHYTDAEHGGREYVLETDDDLEKLRLRHHPLSAELLSNFHTLTCVIFALLNRPMVIYGFFQIATGVITATCIGRSNKVFGMLAHVIKGAVFVWMGILTFGRVLGAFANLGWAWNLRPPVPRARQSLGARFFQCSMEMIESDLIFFYGVTNIFMEHLGNQDGKWSHKDLQHASIAFMFIGGGLCGLLFEYTTIRRLLNAQYGFSYNPFPLFTIFWTGILMSQHHQATELSTKIHMQWGYLFAIAAVFRGITYIIMYISPPKSYHPSRPMTEVLVSFCLIAGGAVFMSSNQETVDSLLYYGVDGMFTMNLTVGSTALFMSWLMVLMALKGWASQRRS
ncbi:hypothetical protein V1506DRAFT_566484 [Lipomyces tetrasporus]